MRFFFLLVFLGFINKAHSQGTHLMYHNIRVDSVGHILPWSHDEPGKAWSHVINLTWNFWDTMRRDMNGIPYYMNHQVWRPTANDPRGLGGDQLPMALSSFRLLYAWSGNERVRENMKFIADYYLSHSLSPASSKWPHLPFPYNTMVYSGNYDGDMVIGKDFTQPDKAGSFGWELYNLYRMTRNERYPNKTSERYLEAATLIAKTLAAHITEGTVDHSPMPFKVNVFTGEPGRLEQPTTPTHAVYTTNYSATMELFLALIDHKSTDSARYRKAFNHLLKWMKKYPMKNDRWGPFFEDIPGWSDTQINAITFAQFIMKYPQFFPAWKTDVERIFDWVYKELGNDGWKKFGLTAINEQTAYRVPGNSHTSRQASAELEWARLTTNHDRVPHAIRQLNWSTYMVHQDGRNRYPQDEIWLTDGYGDYIRHFLRAMAAFPELAPPDEVHLVSSTSVIQQATYNNFEILNWELGTVNADSVYLFYRCADTFGTEVIRMPVKPTGVTFDTKPALHTTTGQGYSWRQLEKGGLLTITRDNVKRVMILR